jgi:hypothetical protein
MNEQGQRSTAALYFRKSKLTVERCNGLRCSLAKNALPVGFTLARFFQPCADDPQLVAA